MIPLDKLFSTLISNKIPEGYPETANSNKLMTEAFDKAVQFSIGLGIHYGCNILNRPCNTGQVNPGWRAPDALLQAPGSRLPVRLQDLTKNDGSYWVIVLAGQPLLLKDSIRVLRYYLDSGPSFINKMPVQSVRFLTIIAGKNSSSERALGVRSFGDAYYDLDSSAHTKYGISVESGALVVLRPDGWLAFATTLDGFHEIEEYFLSISSKAKVAE